ncbi:MAG TPA: PQQ-dependent sugar dehydrogenase [Thermodesulfobacteriota bacterium]|nr:PQQ-dependent sugar dehydrogenase [Thermodesulfobacteriota bacterium]
MSKTRWIRVVLGFIIFTLLMLLLYFGGSALHSEKTKDEMNARLVEPWVKIKLQRVASGFEQPTYLTHADDGSERIFVVEKEGRIKIINDGNALSKPFLDIASRVGSRGSEQGLLSVVFHPGYSQNGRFFVNYTNRDGNTVVAEYRVTDNPDRADKGSEGIIITIEQPASNHNGGQLQFGPDGYLYIGMGDGGRGGDPWGNAQNKQALLGKILRIDVDGGKPYGIPKDNPFVGEKRARPEIWAYGLRNPWRFSFDTTTGDMYIADVGQYEWEEIDFQPAGSNGGENYGWDLFEGSHPFELPDEYNPGLVTMPVVEYSHDLGCSITGGYVYRGESSPSISGVYFFSDFCSGQIWGLRRTSEQGWEWAEFLDTSLSVSSFGQDERGEIYVLDFEGGAVYHITVVGK